MSRTNRDFRGELKIKNGSYNRHEAKDEIEEGLDEWEIDTQTSEEDMHQTLEMETTTQVDGSETSQGFSIIYSSGESCKVGSMNLKNSLSKD